MKKIFLFLFALALFSCAGEIYQEEITIKEGLAYKKDSNSLYSGTVLDRYGEPLGSYKKGLKDGEWIEIDLAQGTQRTANYIKGTPNGEQITYVFPGAREKSKRLEYINYENGNPVGIWTQWGRDSENRIRKSGEITLEEGSGRWREWDLNTRAVTRAGDYENWKRVGTWKSWDANEVLVSEGEYVDGKKEGKWTWFEKGEDKGWQENYVGGVLNGAFHNLSIYANNRGKGTYDNGVRTGDWEEYYNEKENGSLERKQSGAYVFGKKEGMWSHYKKNGRRTAEGTYKNNIKEGSWTEGPDIDFASRFYGTGQYLNNKKSGEWNYVAPRKNPIVKGFFSEGEPSGTWDVQYNKKKYTGTFEDLKKQIPKLNEYKF